MYSWRPDAMSTTHDRVLISTPPCATASNRPGRRCPWARKSKSPHQLAKLKVDVMEVGFPVSSPVQFEATRLCAEQITGPVICALARANAKDIEAAGQAIEPARRRRIHTFIASSPIHMEHKLQKRPDEVLRMAVEAVRLAREFTDDVEFSPEDACRSENAVPRRDPGRRDRGRRHDAQHPGHRGLCPSL